MKGFKETSRIISIIAALLLVFTFGYVSGTQSNNSIQVPFIQMIK